MSTGDAIQLASTAFAAFAAIGSGVAAWVMYRQWSGSRTPALSVDVSVVFPKRTCYLTVVNYGGPVKKVCFAVVEGAQACMGFLPPHGFLGPGERASLQLGVDADTDDRAIAVVYGFDLDGNTVYAWAANGQNGRWPARSSHLRRRPTDLSAVQILKRFYPDAADPTELEQRATVLVPASSAF
jgi:hypothetical protein